MRPLSALKVRGPFRGGTGYDHHTRSFVRGFLSLGVAVELEDCPWWSRPLPPELQDPLFDRLSAPVPSRVQLEFVMPHQVTVSPGLTVANYTMFEATRIPAQWVDAARRGAMTVVPSRSSREAWMASGVPSERLRVCPLGVRAGLDAPGVSPLPLVDHAGRPLADYRYRFLNVAEVIPRKNLLGVLEVWVRATTRRDDAVLILKANRFRPGLWELFQADVAAWCRQTGASWADAAPIVLLADYLSDGQMANLYRTATHYMSLSFGEGWDLPMTEAAAAGLGLIAPRHSAYLDYLDDDVAHLVPAVEAAADRDYGRFAAVDRELFHGLRWWAPDHEAAATLVRDIIDGRAPAKASPQRRIAGEFSWDAVSRRLIDILAEL